MHLNFNNPDQLRKDVENLTPINGVCIFIDICKSTEVKQKSVKEWICFIGNTLNLCSGTSFLFAENIIKLIGDEIMIYIPDDKIISSNENYFTILDFLNNSISSWGPDINKLTLKAKASIHYCTDSYNISYFKKMPDDYYGNDIDLTARLINNKEFVKEKIIAISEIFYQKVIQINSDLSMYNISEVYKKQFNGFKEETQYRIMKVIDQF